ncbi:hypothetical protein [Leptothoe sp. PORK10 BA2]|uniref:hypothetical protein n=1 Tax=Leptothoe sp. PORK10 BA2 TaxID=3110254 RepID=UPI002B200601|nr:hypothetical protein [Leptothoe sp. PORK10 BA2]MEA5465833.1 hypothetical protein [Leptothoe sp. PORK10 BA2]
MDFARLAYIKNINDETDWAYKEYPVCSYFPLNFKRGDGVEAHASNLPKGSLIILSQKPPKQSKRYLTHVVELCNEHHEDKPQWDLGPWGIVRWAKICWAADFSNVDMMPADQDVMQAEWGWYDTKAKSLESPNLMKKWNSIDELRTHLQKIFV